MIPAGLTNQTIKDFKVRIGKLNDPEKIGSLIVDETSVAERYEFTRSTRANSSTLSHLYTSFFSSSNSSSEAVVSSVIVVQKQ